MAQKLCGLLPSSTETTKVIAINKTKVKGKGRHIYIWNAIDIETIWF